MGEFGVSQWKRIKAMIEGAPIFSRPIEDLTLLTPYGEIIKAIVSLILPPAFLENEAAGIFVPFNLQPVYVSDSFKTLLLDQDGRIKGIPALGEENFLKGRILRAYYLILEKYYGIRQKFEYPVIRVVSDPETGLDMHLRIKPNLQFMEIHHKGEPKRLSDKEKTRLLENLADPEILREILPPEDFEIHGFAVFSIVDVTQSETLSALGKDLIDQESIFSQAGFLRLQQRVRNLFRSPDLVISLAAIHDEQVILLNLGCELSADSVFSGSRHLNLSEFNGSLYAKAVEENNILRIRDIAQLDAPSRIEQELKSAGVRSIMIAPLTYQGKLIGTLDIASPKPDEFSPIDILLLSEIAPIFSLAIKKALEEIDHNVQAIIKEKCTAVHPSVEWRFRKAAFKHLDRLRNGENSDMEPIVFRDVYPLYAVSDIRGSSLARNRAVKEDLLEHLNLSLSVLEAASLAKPMTVLEEVHHRLAGESKRISAAISPADELELSRFIRTEVESLFPHIKHFSHEVVMAINKYEAALDPRLSTIYRRRREFEESVSKLNQYISLYLDREEADAQSLYPHYFEKHQTDGVDYLIYVGASLTEEGKFSRLYLENLRLWQMMTACGIALITEEVKKQVKVPLETAHMILLNHSPISIRFRFDEKRFDVDGAYDVRHEIIKARLDKATLKGGSERLTQPRMISVVFSQPVEGKEAHRHLSFLLTRGFLKGDIQTLELEEMPGIQGLMALRAEINLESPRIAERVNIKNQ